MEEKIKNKKKIMAIAGLFAIVLTLVGVTYAFFNYTRTGSANTIRVGKIAFNTTQGPAINLTNVFPVDVTEGIPNDANVGSVTINVTGDTTYSGGVEYLVTATNVSNTAGSKQLPISIDVSYSANGTGKTIGTEVTGNTDYFTVRGGNTSYYKVLAEDTITDNDNLVVGYIAPGATGIDGNIVIRAYIDAAKVAISDTYDGSESDENGTTTSWVNNRTVFTTTEWNSLQTNGISFQIKVEANEGTWVTINPTLYSVIESQNPTLDNQNSTYVQNVSTSDETNAKVTFLDNVENQGKVIKLSAGINFGEISSDTNGKGVYIRSGTENSTYPIYYYRGDVDNNNVAFAGFCWLIVRTTETGGVKLVYNGVQDANGTCLPLTSETSGETSGEASGETSGEASGEASGEINSTRRLGTQTVIGATNYAYSDGNSSPAYVGYMYGTVYEYSSKGWNSGAYFGSGFTYQNGQYTLTGATVTSPDATHHYSCNSTNASGTCTSIRYVYSKSAIAWYSITLTGGDGIEETLTKMQVNTTSSNAKTIIDNWYASNMTTYTDKLEDTVWCNDRSIARYNGWSTTGEIGVSDERNASLLYGARERSNYASSSSTTKNQPSLTCSQANDRFTVSSSNGNGALTYPVGLLTADEIMLGGNSGYNDGNVSFYLYNGYCVWTMSPSDFFRTTYYGDQYSYQNSLVSHANVFTLCYSGFGNGANEYANISNGYFDTNGAVSSPAGLRPAVSLKLGTTIVNNGADGTAANPYRVN